MGETEMIKNNIKEFSGYTHIIQISWMDLFVFNAVDNEFENEFAYIIKAKANNSFLRKMLQKRNMSEKIFNYDGVILRESSKF